MRNVSVETKRQVYAAYGIEGRRAPGEFEVDHLVPLELGGSNELANLWPEPAEPRPGFREKDAVENFLHDEMCRGALALPEAQRQIATSWVEVYRQHPGLIVNAP